jgi:2-polyprenyl-3-methyl-5-hydroxy-6-metoxy-1,4-benzoquinol methylase
VSTAPKHEYAYREASASWAHSYLVPPLLSEIERLKPTRAFEIGAGSGHVASLLAKRGIEVTAIEPSESGVALARRHHPDVKMHSGSVYDNLAETYGRFPLVLSLEVVEHLMYPRLFAKAVFDLLEAGGTAIVSTPYHGYWKNLVLALSGKMDAHFTALWDGGHVKFWSIATLTSLMEEAGLQIERVVRVGRVPPLAKSMIFILRRPEV